MAVARLEFTKLLQLYCLKASFKLKNYYYKFINGIINCTNFACVYFCAFDRNPSWKLKL